MNRKIKLMPQDDSIRIENAIRAMAAGEIIAVVDDEDRENEGDLIMAAAKTTPEKLAFIIRHTCGILCAPLSLPLAQRLGLDPMVAHNDAPLGTAFTVSVDAVKGLTTGISATERSQTLNALANPDSKFDDFVRPGHVFPLIARDGGVLMRSGHTEAAVDLCRLAGLPEVGAICELVNDDGTVMKGQDITMFCEKHSIPLISVADLIAYRRRREQLISQSGEMTIETSIGAARAVAFRSNIDGVEHLALVFGNIYDGRPVPTRLHRSSVLDDVFGEQSTIKRSFATLVKRERGVLIYLREGGAGVVPESIIKDEKAKSEGGGAGPSSWYDVGLGAQILRALSVTEVELLTSSQLHYVGLDGFDITIASTSVIEEK